MDIIDMILDKKPNLKLTDINGWDPIYLAVYLSNIDLYNKLIESDEVDLHRTYNESEQNLLHIACQKGCYEIAISLMDNHQFLPDEQDKSGNTPLHYAVMYWPKENEVIFEYEEEEDYEPNKNRALIISELIYRGCDPSQLNKNGRSPFTLIQQQEIMEIIGKAMEDPQHSVNLEKRREYWSNLEREQIQDRYETRKLATKRLNDVGNSRSRRTMKMTKEERIRREEQLSIMTARGGTLRISENSKEVPKSSKVRPWGGSNETYMFQKEIRTKLREMHKSLKERIDDIYSQVIQLRDIVYSKENNYENDNEANNYTNDLNDNTENGE